MDGANQPDERWGDMSREVRRVHKDWEHPRDANGFIPMRYYFPYNDDEVREGIREGWMTDDPPHYGQMVMPDWGDNDRTHLMMYETTSEGTPISPAFETEEDLAKWLADNGASAFGGMTARYEDWLETIRRGWSVGMVMTVLDGSTTNIRSGVGEDTSTGGS